jgi:hypothetical protein
MAGKLRRRPCSRWSSTRAFKSPDGSNAVISRATVSMAESSSAGGVPAVCVLSEFMSFVLTGA